MDDRPSCCSGAGCVIMLLLALAGVGYFVYTHVRVEGVYRAKSAQETIDRVQEMQRQDPGGIHRLAPTTPP